jgi:hypothetical protein
MTINVTKRRRERAREKLEKQLKNSGFSATNMINYEDFYSFRVDELSKKIAWLNYYREELDIVKFSDISRCEFTETRNVYTNAEESIKLLLFTRDMQDPVKSYGLTFDRYPDKKRHEAVELFRKVQATIEIIVSEHS